MPSVSPGIPQLLGRDLASLKSWCRDQGGFSEASHSEARRSLPVVAKPQSSRFPSSLDLQWKRVVLVLIFYEIKYLRKTRLFGLFKFANLKKNIICF